jgi:hypothetical protein
VRWGLLLCLLLAGCAAVPIVDCACDEKRIKYAEPLDDGPEEVTCRKTGQYMVCYPVSGRA